MEHNTQTVAANAAATLANDIEATASTTTMPASNTKSRSINSDIDKSPTSCCSNNSLTSSSSSTTSSAPQYSEDIRRHMPPGNLDLLPRQGSGSSNKTCEVDLGEEERDSFSPVTNTNSSNSHSPLELGAGSFPINVLNLDPSTSNKLQYDNKIIEGSQQILSESKPKPNTQVADVASSGNLSTTKEQKQRQNEEIVIMETSSVSSETGSWESVFPQAGPVPVTCANVMLPSSDLRSDLKQFVTMEKPLEQHKLEEETRGSDFLGAQKEGLHMSPYFNTEATANTSSLLNNVTVGMSMTSLLRDLDKRDNALNTSGTSACFIDASSLRDEDEVLSFPSLETHQQLPPDDCVKNQEEHFTPAAVASKEEPVNSTDCVEEEDDDDSPTKKLETFHMVFAKCKTKSKDVLDSSPLAETNSVSSSSSHSAADSPQKQSPSSVNNLSDEEKLWKRNQENPTTKLATEKDKHSTHEDITEASVSLAVDLDSSDSSDIVKLRREQRERKISAPMQVMPQQLQQFTIHPLGASPKFNQHHPQLHQHTAIGSQVSHQSHHSDVSYTTDYSSSSPAPSLAWSEHEHRSTHIPTRSQANDSLTNHSMLPDTPHNSIVHIENGSSNASSHRDYTLSSSFSHQRDSGAYCSDATDSPIPLPRTPKRSKYDETNPIISGGVSIKDIYVKKCESPTPQRRTENCPIVSGGFVSLDFEPTRPLDEPEDGEEAVEMRKKSLARKPISNLASWVVDMSDCRPERRKSTSSNSSLEASKFRERSDSNSSHKSGCGFFVSLNDMDKKPEAPKPQENQMSKSYTAPKSAGFFVNLTQSDYQPKVGESPSKAENVKDEMSDSMEKKNIFSMFIDIGDDKKSGGIQKKEPYHLAQRLSSSINNSQKRNDDIMKSSASSTETLMSKSSNFKNTIVAVESNGENTESKSLDYKCNIEPPITVAAIRRLSQQHRNQNEASKRHSWGNSQVKDTTSDCKRSTSFTVNPSDAKESAGNGLMSIIDKLPLLSKASSLSVDSSVSPYDEYMGSKSEISSTCSNNSNRNSASEREDEAVPAIPGARFKKRRKDAQINETYDKSSVGSLTDGVISKDLSPASNTDTDDITFQQDEEMAAAAVASNLNAMNSSSGGNSNRTSAIIMETIIEAKETSSPKKTAGAGHTMESLHATIEKQQKMLLETVNENTEVGKSAFVKLSDMDKPIRLEDKSPERMMSKSAGGNTHRHMSKLYRDGNDGNNKTRPYSWGMTRSTGNNSFHNITNSADNLRSLSRLFPNFSKEFSSSMPSDITMEQADYIQTDLSNDSSLASSFSRSGMDESSISCRQPRRLGEDLLKMFLQEIATDMIVEVHGRKLKAHKCILRSRCQYFAAMLAGSNASSVVSLQGYSYSAVHFALCHIYSGASHPPDGISLMELAALADLLGLEGLKEVTAHALRINYCHNFHKPCTGCIDGILQVLPVALNHALDDLYRKCLRWTCRHYLKVWPTRQFSQLPPDILGRCRQQIVAYLVSEN